MSHRGSSRHHHSHSHKAPAGLSPEEESEYKSAVANTQAFCKSLGTSLDGLTKKNPFLQPLCEKSHSVVGVISRLNDCTNPTPIKAFYLAPLLKKAMRAMAETFGLSGNTLSPSVDAEMLKRWKKDERVTAEERVKRMEGQLTEVRDAIVSSVVGIDPANVLGTHNETHLQALTRPEDLRIFEEKSDMARLESLILAYHRACGEVDNVHLSHSQYIRASLADRIMRFFCDSKLDTRQLAQFSEKFRLEHMNQGVIIACSKMYSFSQAPADLRKEWCRKTVRALPYYPPEIALHCTLAIRETALSFKDKKLAEMLSESIVLFDHEEIGFAQYFTTIVEAIKTEMPSKKKSGHGGGHDDGSAEEGSHGGAGHGAKGKKGKKGGHDEHEEEHGGHGGKKGKKGGHEEEEEHGGHGKKGKKGGKKGGHDEHSGSGHEEHSGGSDEHGGHGKKGKKGGHGDKHGKKKGHHDEEEEEHENHYDDEEDSGGIIDSITTSFGQMWASIVGSGDEDEDGSGGSHRSGGSDDGHRKKSKKGKKGHDEDEHSGHGGGKKKGSKKGGHDEEHEEEGHGSARKKGSKKGGHEEEHEEGHGSARKKGSKKGGHEEEHEEGHGSARKRGSKKGGHEEEEHSGGGGGKKKRGSSRHEESDHVPQRESHSASHGKARGRKH